MSDVVVTREQVIDLIKNEKMKPSDLFNIESLETDPIVRGLAEDRVKERIAGEYRRRREVEEKLEKFTPEKEQLLKQIKDLKTSAAKSQLGSLLDKQKTGRKLDDRQVKFIQNRLSRFEVQNPDEIEKEFATFLDNEVDEYGRIAKEVFGIEAKPTDGATDGKDKAATGREPDEKQAATTDNKYLDPKQNPFIKIE